MKCKITPPKLAKRWGTSPDKIIAFILAGELRAIDGAAPGCSRRRYLIDEADVEAFEKSREVVQSPAITRVRPPQKRQPVTSRKYF